MGFFASRLRFALVPWTYFYSLIFSCVFLCGLSTSNTWSFISRRLICSSTICLSIASYFLQSSPGRLGILVTVVLLFLSDTLSSLPSPGGSVYWHFLCYHVLLGRGRNSWLHRGPREVILLNILQPSVFVQSVAFCSVKLRACLKISLIHVIPILSISRAFLEQI